MGAASLYWHVRDKEELLGLLLDRIVGEASVPDPDPENWREQVKQLGRENRRLLQSHRDAAQISLGRIPIGPHSMPVLERNLAVLLAAGLPPRVIALAADMFALFVGGFAFEESMDNSEPADTEQLGEYFRSLPPEDFPTLARARRRPGRRRCATSASSSRSSCSCAGSRRWPRTASRRGPSRPARPGRARSCPDRRAPSRAAPLRLRELDVAVLDDLDVVAPRVGEAQVAVRLDPGLQQRVADRVAVVDHEPEVAVVVRPAAALGEREELVAHVEEGHPAAPARAARRRTAARRGRARRRDRRPRAPRG